MSQTGPRAYITFDPSQGYPAGPGIFYECLRCGGVLESMGIPGECSCDNVVVDPDAGRVMVREKDKMRAFRISG